MEPAPHSHPVKTHGRGAQPGAVASAAAPILHPNFAAGLVREASRIEARSRALLCRAEKMQILIMLIRFEHTASRG